MGVGEESIRGAAYEGGLGGKIDNGGKGEPQPARLAYIKGNML